MNHRPQSLFGLAKIMRQAFAGNSLADLHAELRSRIQSDNTAAAAMLDLSVVLQLDAQPEQALQLQWQALQLQQHYRLRSNTARPALRVLAIMGPGEVMANTPIEFLLEDSDIALEMLYVGAGIPPTPDIPKHDVAFMAVCESDASQQLLGQLEAVMKYWPHPHVNSPARIAKLSRDRVGELLAGIEGVEAVQSKRISRLDFTHVARRNSGYYPLIARPANSHAGHGLSKLDTATDVAAYLDTHTQDEFSVAPFVDYRSAADGLYRKFRVSVIGGKAYPAHMAVSPRWMVHYLNADMVENAVNRAAEARFMDSFDWEFGARHQPAMAVIDERIGLDYYSLDCAETSDGKLLVFEIDSGAVVHSMDPVDVFPYKRPHMQKLFSAFQALLKQKAWGANTNKIRSVA